MPSQARRHSSFLEPFPAICHTFSSRHASAYPGAGKQFKKLGAILGGLTPSHKARIKLMLLLGANAGLAEIRESFEGPG